MALESRVIKMGLGLVFKVRATVHMQLGSHKCYGLDRQVEFGSPVPTESPTFFPMNHNNCCSRLSSILEFPMNHPSDKVATVVRFLRDGLQGRQNKKLDTNH